MNPLTSNGNNNPDDVEAYLRRALNTEAEMVNPAGDGLGQIRAGIDAQQRVWWRNPLVALAAAAVIGLALGAGAMVLNGDDGNTNVVADQPSASASATASPSPSETPSSTPSPSESPSQAAAQVNLPIYYVHDDGQSLRLYREFHPVSVVGGNRIGAALMEMFAGKPMDPDYTSLWPKNAGVNEVTKAGDTASIDLNVAATKANVGSAAAEISLQQLVYTVTAADPGIKKVRLTVDGKNVSELWGHVAVGTKAFERAPAVDVQGLIWLLSPKEGEKVGRTLQIKGVGTAFEGTISWEVQKVGGTIVEKGFTQGGANGEFAEFVDSVTLPPGTYEIRAFESSAEDGRPLHIDDKTFTVE